MITLTEKKVNKYWQIEHKDSYLKLLKSGMFFEFHPELSGDWSKDLPLIRNGKPIEVKQMEIQPTPTPQLTAMQEFIIDLEIAIGRDLPKSIKHHYLAKEKQQIINDFNEGYRQGESSADIHDNDIKDVSFFNDAINHYTQTYKKI